MAKFLKQLAVDTTPIEGFDAPKFSTRGFFQRMRMVKAILGPTYKAAYASGSRVISPTHINGHTDYDLCVLVKDLIVAIPRLLEKDFVPGVGYVEADQADTEQAAEAMIAAARKKGAKYPFVMLDLPERQLNLLITQDDRYFEKRKFATHIAKRLGLHHRDDRIVLFHAVLYGALPNG